MESKVGSFLVVAGLGVLVVGIVALTGEFDTAASAGLTGASDAPGSDAGAGKRRG